jgi:hypothetical protein
VVTRRQEVAGLNSQMLQVWFIVVERAVRAQSFANIVFNLHFPQSSSHRTYIISSMLIVSR